MLFPKGIRDVIKSSLFALWVEQRCDCGDAIKGEKPEHECKAGESPSAEYPGEADHKHTEGAVYDCRDKSELACQPVNRSLH